MRKSWRVVMVMAVLVVGVIALMGPLGNQAEQGCTLTYQTLDHPLADIYEVQVPPGGPLRVFPAVSEKVKLPEAFAARYPSAQVVLNGGFFDPANAQTTSYVTVEGVLVADPTTNERLMENPGLSVYMDQILNRSEFRTYQCQTAPLVRYDITAHRDPLPVGCQMVGALGAGPVLLPTRTDEIEAFVAYNDQKALIRDPIGVGAPNARSAVGIRPDGTVILVMAAQRQKEPKKPGVTLTQLASVMTSLGAEKALALDGGGSSALFLQGQTRYGKLDPKGQWVKRPVKSVLLVAPFVDTPTP